ncbi:MAG: hypothetical protein ABUS79_30985, partial [Pseudomonadota bacterium]
MLRRDRCAWAGLAWVMLLGAACHKETPPEAPAAPPGAAAAAPAAAAVAAPAAGNAAVEGRVKLSGTP